MAEKRQKFNLENPAHVAELIDLIENGDLSDLEDADIDEGDEDDVIDIVNPPVVIRDGGDIANRTDMEPQMEDVRSDEDSDDELPLINLQTKKSKSATWERKSFTPPNITECTVNKDTSITQPLYPIEYFERYIPKADFENMAYYTNMYAIQKGVSFKNTTASEIQILFALHIIIGCLNKFPRVRMYWERILGIGLFLDNMTRDRFFQLRTCLHLVNNLDRPENCTDKLYKVRPMIEAIRKRCSELNLEEELCIDEQIIPFTGKLSIKQYIKGKPCPWGIKVFVLCGKSGQAFDFVFYQGKTTGLSENNQKLYGQGAAVVLHLAERIFPNEGYKLFYDNYFSSYSLLNILREKKIYAAGTIRANRFYKPPLLSDKEMMKNGRGFIDEVVSQDGIVLVKWLDNKTVYLASNFVGRGTEDMVKRWDKKSSKYVEVNRPEIIKRYNHSMGGVDLLDQFISTYRIFIRSRKWTLRVIMHMVDFALANSWIEYKKDCEKCHIGKKDVLDLLSFRMRVAESLIQVGKVVNVNKRGRPFSSPKPSPPVHRRGEKRPLQEIQFDNVDHMPQFDNNKEATRCKSLGCKGRTHVFCQKCKVHLCLIKDRNCFTNFHKN